MTPSTAQLVRARWNPRSIVLIVAVWLVLQLGCLFTPGLLDDVDSIYIEIARQMLVRHDYITPYIDGVRFFDKPPLMYWLAAGSMHLFGASAWAARLPLALLTLALFLAVYALSLRLFRTAARSERAAFYSALVLATSIGPFLYTRFFIPDILICLWMTLAVHAFLVALDRLREPAANSALLPCLAFAAVTALNLLTKGLIGIVFPLAFVVLYLGLTRQLNLLRKLHLLPSGLLFLLIAAPWHVLAALRNPAIALPSGMGLPAHGGWAWFYLYNEHIARFLSRRIPHDYGQVPIPVFWLLAALWLFPWTTFLPGAFAGLVRELRVSRLLVRRDAADASWSAERLAGQTALTLLLWAGIVMVFFTLSARQEYYSLPALPAFALAVGGFLAAADHDDAGPSSIAAARSALLWHRWLLLPLASLGAFIAIFFRMTAPHVDPRTDIATLLSQGGVYNLSLGHIFDLTPAAMGLFRGPLLLVGLAMLVIGPVAYGLRSRRRTFAANFALAAAAICLLLCVHEGLVRFYPTLGSESLAAAIRSDQAARPAAGDLILIDGELTAGSTLLFYTHQPAHLVDGRVNGPWYGSFWPDAPPIFETESSLRQLWSGPQRIYLLTYHPEQRISDLKPIATVRTVATLGGKSILTNRP